MALNWKCAFCGHAQTASANQVYSGALKIVPASSRHGEMQMTVSGLSCSNTECGELTLDADLTAGGYFWHGGSESFRGKSKVDGWKLRPRSGEKPQPGAVPDVLAQDYYEACRIRDLSPKASATLARRCLQGMIRDFCGISRPTLAKEIEALRSALDDGSAPRGVTPESVDAIDHVRSIGNIGAHMEKDIDRIIPVDEDEAQTLIDLIELLFSEWYVARDTRQKRLAKLRSVAEQKAAERAGTAAVEPPQTA